MSTKKPKQHYWKNLCTKARIAQESPGWNSKYDFEQWFIQNYKENAFLLKIDENLPHGPNNSSFQPKANLNQKQKKPKKNIKQPYDNIKIGAIFGHLEIISSIWHEYNKLSTNGSPQKEWKVKCKCIYKNCNKIIIIDARSIYRGTSSSCGCKRYGDEAISKLLQTRIDRFGTTAPKCGKTQKYIEKWINSFGDNFRPTTKILLGKEIDLYDDNLKLGIEYCGLYWHNENSPEPRNRDYHYNKCKKCQDKGIRLITIFEDEWINREIQCKNFLMAAINKSDVRINGRDCDILEISKKEGLEFIDRYHIQPAKYGMVFFGLFYRERLIGVLSLKTHHRQNTNKKTIVLNRLVFKTGFRIVGGLSKLLKRAKDWSITKGYSQIITWSDNRWSNGHSYLKCGFILDSELPPDYSYILKNTKIRKSKQSCKKQSIKCPDDMTELQYMNNLGYSRIWDCGKKRWVMNI